MDQLEKLFIVELYLGLGDDICLKKEKYSLQTFASFLQISTAVMKVEIYSLCGYSQGTLPTRYQCDFLCQTATPTTLKRIFGTRRVPASFPAEWDPSSGLKQKKIHINTAKHHRHNLNSLCNCPLVNNGSLETICRTVSDRARPAKALQANVLMQSASVMGVFTCISCKRTMIPLLDLTQSQTFWMSSSELLNFSFLLGEEVAFWENLDILPPT